MSEIDRQRVAAVRTLEGLGYTWSPALGGWIKNGTQDDWSDTVTPLEGASITVAATPAGDMVFSNWDFRPRPTDIKYDPMLAVIHYLLRRVRRGKAL